jgi:hypothetical protein
MFPSILHYFTIHGVIIHLKKVNNTHTEQKLITTAYQEELFN